MEDKPAPIKFFTDAHIAKAVAVQLREKGVDIVRCQEVGLADAEDPDLIAYASQERRTIVTHDTGFSGHHQKWLEMERSHFGILIFHRYFQGTTGPIVSINHIEIREGKPRIAGTRIRVQDIANTYIHANRSIEWIVENYEVTPAQIYAALSYYYDHQEQIDREMREGDELAKNTGISSEEHKAQIRARHAAKQNPLDSD